MFFDDFDTFLHEILATFLKKHFRVLSHMILVTKETAFFPRVFAYNFAFGLLIILPSGQCSPAGSRMLGICHKQARRRYWCQTTFRNKCKKWPVCLRGHSFFQRAPSPTPFQHWERVRPWGEDRIISKNLRENCRFLWN